jgi:hypothetical protein
MKSIRKYIFVHSFIPCEFDCCSRKPTSSKEVVNGKINEATIPLIMGVLPRNSPVRPIPRRSK